ATSAGERRPPGGDDAELPDHGVDNGCRLEELALKRPAVDIEAHGLQEVAPGDRSKRTRHLCRRPDQVVDQGVDRTLHLAPGAVGEAELHALASATFAADHLAHGFQLMC